MAFDCTALGIVMSRTVDQSADPNLIAHFGISAVAATHSAVFSLDTCGTVLTWSPHTEAITGHARDDVLGKDFAFLFPDEALERGECARVLEQALIHSHCEEITLLSRRCSSPLWAVMSVTALFDARDQHTGFLVVMREIAGLPPDGSTHERADDAMRNERLFIHAMIESMPGILYFYDSTGRFLRWNRNFEVVSGYSGTEIARMHPLDFYSARERPLVELRIKEVFEKSESSVEANFVSKDGTATPYFFTGRRVLFEKQLCLVGVGIDVSERRLAEDRLAESERKYRELVENANSIILRWNADGRITMLNEFGQRFFGYSIADLVGRHVVGTLVPPAETGGRDLQHLIDEISFSPESFDQNVNENMRSNGERVWIAWTNRIVRDTKGKAIEILSIGTDITERRQAEAERERRHQAEEADRIKSAFLATMSHELRTPLNSIIGFTGIITQELAGPVTAEQRKQLDMVRSSARHLLALVNDVLDISKIEAGQLEVARDPFDLRASIDKVIDLLRPLTDIAQLNLQVTIHEGLGEAVGDARRFEQILLNLLNNAIKFTDEGTVALTAELVTADGPADKPEGWPAIRVCVQDTGIGIKRENLQLLFQPFQQVNSGLARSHEGTGLGLAICHRLAMLMGGHIDAQSEWGKGSTFTLTLPIQGPIIP